MSWYFYFKKQNSLWQPNPSWGAKKKGNVRQNSLGGSGNAVRFVRSPEKNNEMLQRLFQDVLYIY